MYVVLRAQVPLLCLNTLALHTGGPCLQAHLPTGAGGLSRTLYTTIGWYRKLSFPFPPGKQVENEDTWQIILDESVER